MFVLKDFHKHFRNNPRFTIMQKKKEWNLLPKSEMNTRMNDKIISIFTVSITSFSRKRGRRMEWSNTFQAPDDVQMNHWMASFFS